MIIIYFIFIYTLMNVLDLLDQKNSKTITFITLSMLSSVFIFRDFNEFISINIVHNQNFGIFLLLASSIYYLFQETRNEKAVLDNELSLLAILICIKSQYILIVVSLIIFWFFLVKKIDKTYFIEKADLTLLGIGILTFYGIESLYLQIILNGVVFWSLGKSHLKPKILFVTIIFSLVTNWNSALMYLGYILLLLSMLRIILSREHYDRIIEFFRNKKLIEKILIIKKIKEKPISLPQYEPWKDSLIIKNFNQSYESLYLDKELILLLCLFIFLVVM